MRALKATIYKDADARFRWKLESSGHVLADSGQSYSRRVDCLSGLTTVTGTHPIMFIDREVVLQPKVDAPNVRVVTS